MPGGTRHRLPRCLFLAECVRRSAVSAPEIPDLRRYESRFERSASATARAPAGRPFCTPGRPSVARRMASACRSARRNNPAERPAPIPALPVARAKTKRLKSSHSLVALEGAPTSADGPRSARDIPQAAIAPLPTAHRPVQCASRGRAAGRRATGRLASGASPPDAWRAGGPVPGRRSRSHRPPRRACPRQAARSWAGQSREGQR